MKLKTSEAVFIAICLLAAAAAVIAVAISRKHSGEAISVSAAESNGEIYDLSVLNEASAEEFMQIRGIGEVKANAIVEYRAAIGGFKRVSQLCNIDGIGGSVMALIIDYFYGDGKPSAGAVTDKIEQSPPETDESKVEPPSPSVTEKPLETAAELPETVAPERVMSEVNINSATAEEIAKNLLIDSELAEKIVLLRGQIGYFSSVQELYLCDGFNDKIYQKVKNYVKIGE